MVYYKDLREYLKVLEGKGKLVRIKREVNKDTELQLACVLAQERVYGESPANLGGGGTTTIKTQAPLVGL